MQSKIRFNSTLFVNLASFQKSLAVSVLHTKAYGSGTFQMILDSSELAKKERRTKNIGKTFGFHHDSKMIVHGLVSALI